MSGCSSDPADMITIVVAGVACTDYSSMGHGLQNTGTTVLVFYAFAFKVLADLPQIVLLECTVLFYTVLLKIFEGKYIIQLIDFL